MLFFYLNLSLISQDTWIQKSNFGGVARRSAAAFSIDEIVFIGCGTNGTVQQDFWAYNQNTDTWTQKTNFPIARAGVGAFSIGNKGYMGSGSDGVSVYNDLYEYNQQANTWTFKQNYGGTALIGPVAFSIRNRGYFCTGSTGARNDILWEYNSSNNTWTQKASYGGGLVYNATGFSIGNKGYIGTGNLAGNIKTNQFYEYDPSLNSWTRKADFGGTAREYAVGFSIGQRGYIGTGNDIGGFLKKDLWEYNPNTDSWTRKVDFIGTQRFLCTASGTDTKGYIGLGHDGSYTQDFYQYTPSTTPTLDLITINDFDIDNANLSANVSSDGRDTITARGIVYSTTSNPTLNDNVLTTSGTLGSFDLELSNLFSNTTYYARAYATNSFGTSYSSEVSFRTNISPEDYSPNNGDGNNDGIPDSQQSYVYSLFNSYTGNYITILSLDGYTITGAEVLSPNDNINYYPASLVKFTIAHSSASVKIYYHGIESLNGYTFKKLNSQNTLFNFTNYTFGSEVINGKAVATATLTLTDGGPEDYDGVVNGSITDPGGPAILASNANIPVWDWRYLLLLMVLFGIVTWKRCV